MNDTKSLSDLMNEAFSLSLDCAYGELSPPGGYLTARELPVSEEITDMIFGWADGVTHKYYQNHATGHCSLSAMVNFDVESFENSVIKNIEVMKELLDRFGKPVRISFDEMKKRGYRGKWAGYTEREDKEHYLKQAEDILKTSKDLGDIRYYTSERNRLVKELSELN
jgi:hypothetical protein